jgi:hypothetical protein
MKNSTLHPTSNNLRKGISLLFLSLIGLLPGAFAQTTDSTSNATIVEIHLLEGSTISGDLIEETNEHLVINSPSLGRMTIEKSKIDSWKKLPKGSFKEGVYWHATANSSRNIFSPTGYGLEKGEGYYQNFMLFVNQFSYGFTDRFSMGIGIEIATILFRANSFNDSDENNIALPAFMLTPKFSIPIKEDKWNVGIGGVVISVPYTDHFFDAGMVYGISTWGSRDNNITVGLGLGVSEDGIAKRPVITLSGNSRFSKRMAFVTENWLVSNGDQTVMLNTAGFRYLGGRVSIDMALVAGTDGNNFSISPIPLLGVSIPFGKGWGK